MSSKGSGEINHVVVIIEEEDGDSQQFHYLETSATNSNAYIVTKDNKNPPFTDKLNSLKSKNTLTFVVSESGERTILHARNKPVSVVYLDQELTDQNRNKWRMMSGTQIVKTFLFALLMARRSS